MAPIIAKQPTSANALLRKIASYEIIVSWS